MVKKNGILHFIQSTVFFWLIASTIIVFCIANELFYQRYNFSFGGDYWEHTGVFSEWLKNLWQPGMPHVAGYESGASARYMPYYFILTATGQIFALSPMQIMSLAGILNVAFLCFSIQYFFKHYLQKPLAPLIGLVVLFFFWGLAWYWSNVYQLRTLVYTAGYPSTFTIALSLFSLGYIVKLLIQNSLRNIQLIVVALLSFLMFVCHPLTGAFGVGAAGLLALTYPETNLNQRIQIIIAIFIGFILTELWPYYSAIDIALGQTAKENAGWIGNSVAKTTTKEFSLFARASHLYYSHPFYSPLKFVMSLGPALLGIPVLCWLAFKRQQLFLISGFVLMMLPFCINLFIRIPLGHRFVLFAIIFLHISIVWALLQIFEKGTPFWKRLTTTLLVVLILGNVFLAGAELNGVRYRSNLIKTHAEKDAVAVSTKFEELKAIIPPNAVVMAPIQTSWVLPTFLNAKVVGISHPNPYVHDSKLRNIDVKSFFDPLTSATDRLAILRKYNVTHILIPKKSKLSTEIINEISAKTDDDFKYWHLVLIESW